MYTKHRQQGLPLDGNSSSNSSRNDGSKQASKQWTGKQIQGASGGPPQH